MSRGRESFQKRMREKARRDKVQAKRERRESRAAEPTDDDAAAPEEAPPAAPEPKVLAELAELHATFDANRIDFDEFEQRKTELLAQLDV